MRVTVTQVLAMSQAQRHSARERCVRCPGVSLTTDHKLGVSTAGIPPHQLTSSPQNRDISSGGCFRRRLKPLSRPVAQLLLASTHPWHPLACTQILPVCKKIHLVLKVLNYGILGGFCTAQPEA